ncbi:ArnT family glycosyltransferase [Tundrisphaera lichenicola]|uniref:ArnT family glycosyltransferase n=1 Tax=Tundrisphaera lichenicola TaxID=2029860 RepID=UPI003EBEE446
MVLLALTVIGWDLASEPHFVDESAYVSQAFFADLWLNGQRDDPAWLTYAGYDLPPLPKYLIGFSMRAGGFRRPNSTAMWEWYANTSRRFVSAEALTVARIPSVILGALGCLAIYGLGATAHGRPSGLIAALLLMANPLYRMHARRAMSDVPAEALILASLAIGLWAWKRLLSGRGTLGPGLGLISGSGVLCGLATLAKLNGSLSGIILATWAVMACGLRSFSGRGRLVFVLSTLLAGGVAFATFCSLNPFLYAHPQGVIDPKLEPIARMTFSDRVRMIYDHRAGVSTEAKSIFPRDALRTPLEKIEAVAVQGFGRFGPFGPRAGTDSTVRRSRAQDWGACVWLPWVALGMVAASVRGLAQVRGGEPPVAWAVLVQAGVALIVVTAFIPLAWDRYYLSIQPGSALLGAFAVVEGMDWVVRLAVKDRSEPSP